MSGPRGNPNTEKSKGSTKINRTKQIIPMIVLTA